MWPGKCIGSRQLCLPVSSIRELVSSCRVPNLNLADLGRRCDAPTVGAPRYMVYRFGKVEGEQIRTPLSGENLDRAILCSRKNTSSVGTPCQRCHVQSSGKHGSY